MARASSRCLKAIVGLSAALVLMAGCGGGSAERVSADAPILVETTPSLVTLENKSGLPLMDVEVSILPYGPGEFTRRLSRLENTTKRQVALTEFRGRDGTPLNLRVVRPKTVRVRAKDAAGKDYEVERPWK